MSIRPGGPSKADLSGTYSPLFLPGTGKAFRADGDSYLATDAQNSSAATRYINKLQTKYGFTLTNVAVSGAMMCSTAQRAIGTISPYAPGIAGGVVLVDSVTNNGLKQRATAISLNGFRKQLEALCWRLRAQSVLEQTGFTETVGTWSTNTLNLFSGGSNRQSSSTGATYTIPTTSPGDYAVLVHALSSTFSPPAYAAAFDVLLNGVLVKSMTLADMRMASTTGDGLNSGHGPVVVPVLDVPDGNNTITVTRTTAADTNGILYADALYKASVNPPTIILLKAPNMSASVYSTYGQAGQSSLDMDAYNLQIDKVAALFPAGQVLVVDPDAAGFDRATMLGGDGIHPNDTGEAFYAGLLANTINRSPRMGYGLPAL